MKVLHNSFLTALILISLLALSMGRCANIKGLLDAPIDPIVGTWVGECNVMSLATNQYTYVFTYDDEQISLTVSRAFSVGASTCTGNFDMTLVQQYGVALGAASSITFDGNPVDAQEIDYTATTAEVTAYTVTGQTSLTGIGGGFSGLTFDLNQPVPVAGVIGGMGMIRSSVG